MTSQSVTKMTLAVAATIAPACRLVADVQLDNDFPLMLGLTALEITR